ncbi:MAG: hypothetical protein AB1468_06385, partial [Candidatus Micrarchaeota archaeon]
KRVLANKRIICHESFLGGGSVLNRENTRVLINSYAHSYVLRVFWLALKVVKELYPDVGKIDGLSFDSMVRRALSSPGFINSA